MKKLSIKVYICMFIVVICLPWFIWFFLQRYVDTSNSENRQMAARPQLSMDTYNTFSKEYEAYCNDCLPFRNNLIKLNSTIDYFLFDRSSNSNVIIGKDDWLFYDNIADGDNIGHYTGVRMYTEEELQLTAQNCINMRDSLAEQGIEFVLYIAPNKERVMSEYMPDKYGKPAENYATLQLVNYLRENTDIRVVYPYEELMEAKEKLKDVNIWYKTDTHWNYVGGYVGSCALLKELGIDMPAIWSEQITISEDEADAGDLAGMLNLNGILDTKEKNYIVEGYDAHNVETIQEDFTSVFSYHAENADSRKIYIYRDSFTTHMAEYIGSQFNDSYMRHTGTYNYADLQEQNPDIFVYETVERYANNIMSFNLYQ
ncbi:MAG: hypothetical protein SOW32_07460 [Agathobacter sp.]|nr:hypothetical protein [Agathobacter sp.]